MHETEQVCSRGLFLCVQEVGKVGPFECSFVEVTSRLEPAMTYVRLCEHWHVEKESGVLVKLVTRSTVRIWSPKPQEKNESEECMLNQ